MTGRLLGGRYELEEIVGQGGMAVVYRGVDRTLGREVAIKVLREQYSSDPEFVERLEREARAAARIAHPNAVHVFDVGSDGETHFIVMELVSGESLKSLIRRAAPLPPAQVIRIGREIASALDFAHRRGLVHRDVKPQNVLMDQDGQTKLTDFGIAQAAEHVALTQTGMVMGTAQYMSPEQARGEPTSPASDIYSLGVVLYELATGRLPFQGETPLAIALRHVQEEPVRPSRLNPSLPPALEQVILRALEKDPRNRYGSAADLAEGLVSGPDPVQQRTTRVAQIEPHRRETGRTVTQGGAPGAGARRPPPPRRRKQGAGAGTVVLLLLVLLSLGALGLGFNWLLGAGRPGPASSQAAASPTPLPAVAASPTRVAATAAPPTATRPPATATPAPAPTSPPPTAAPSPPPPPPPTVARVAMPKLIGLSLGAAQQQVTQRGLVLEFRDGSDPRQPDGVILDQTPREGESVAVRSVVRLVVNRVAPATTVAVPNVGGLEEEEARKVLTAAGFKTTVEREKGPRKGVVQDQSPEPGIKVAPGSEVKIVIGS